MKNIFRNVVLTLVAVAENEIFRTPFPHSTALWWVLREIFTGIKEIKKAEKALKSSISALYPGSESNRYIFKGYWCLRPARTSKNALKTQIDLAKECKTMHFRTQFPHSDRTPFLRI
jgi:hypothetical protein